MEDRKFVQDPFRDSEILLKAQGHKYIKKIGTGPNARYIYDLPKGRQRDERVAITWESKIVPKALIKKVAEMYNQVSPEDAQKINDAIEKFKSGNDSWAQNTVEGKINRDREILHNKIKSDYFKAAREAKPKGDKKVVFMAGLPASGKTYATQNIFRKVEGFDGKVMEDDDGERYVVLNADDIKQYLPEYDKGRAAAFVHNESSHLNSDLVNLFSNMGLNIIIDGTLAKEKKAASQIDGFKHRGYKSLLIHVNVPVEVALERAHKRYMEEGRFVAYDLIASYVAPIHTTVDHIKDKFDDYQRIENK